MLVELIDRMTDGHNLPDSKRIAVESLTTFNPLVKYFLNGGKFSHEEPDIHTNTNLAEHKEIALSYRDHMRMFVKEGWTEYTDFDLSNMLKSAENYYDAIKDSSDQKMWFSLDCQTPYIFVHLRSSLKIGEETRTSRCQKIASVNPDRNFNLSNEAEKEITHYNGEHFTIQVQIYPDYSNKVVITLPDDNNFTYESHSVKKHPFELEELDQRNIIADLFSKEKSAIHFAKMETNNNLGPIYCAYMTAKAIRLANGLEPIEISKMRFTEAAKSTKTLYSLK